jgi:diaminopimelate decarboxylase
LIPTDVVGPICESGDYFCKERPLPKVAEGDFLVLLSAGAYGFVMASNYNSRPMPAEVMVQGKQHAIVRQRQPVADLWRLERIPGWLRA